MRLNCPSCGAQYEVEDNAIPDEGRDVQCSACGHGWFQYPPVTGSASPFGAPEPFAARPAAEPAPEPVVVADPPPPVRPQALDDIREFLRQEAARETEQRRQERVDRPEPPPAPPKPEPAVEKLPDLAEMNSSLRPGPVRQTMPEPDRGGFRTGFFAVLLLLSLLGAGYAMAPQLAEALPASREPLLRYVTAVDAARTWLSEMMQR